MKRGAILPLVGTSRDETPASIHAWADQTFGPGELPARWQRFLQELIEARDYFSTGDMNAFLLELPDLFITLCGVVPNLQTLVNDKMAINRARKWTLYGDGTGQHSEDAGK